MAVALQATLLISGIVALQSGEAEEERVERVVSEGLIEAHEARAQVFVFASAAVLAAMALALLLKSNGAAMRTAAFSTLGTLVVFQLGYRTGQAGGELVYEHGAAQAYTPDPSSQPPGATVAGSDDDD
jgi:hypothetical protein